MVTTVFARGPKFGWPEQAMAMQWPWGRMVAICVKSLYIFDMLKGLVNGLCDTCGAYTVVCTVCMFASSQ